MSIVSATASQDLALINEAQERRLKEQGSGRAQVGFVRDVETSLLRHDWAEFLSTASLALSLIGSCSVAATSPLAHAVSLKDAEPKGGFKYMKYPELKPCLIQVSDAGRIALTVAEKNMDLINCTYSSLKVYISKILQYLPSMPGPGAEALNIDLELLKQGSGNCLSYAEAIEDEFKRWISLVYELYHVLAVVGGGAAIAGREANSILAAVKVDARLIELGHCHAQDAAKRLKSSLDDAKKQYEKAAAAVPESWESIGSNLARGLVSQTSTLLAQTLPVRMMAASPMAMLNNKNGSGGGNTRQGEGDSRPSLSGGVHSIIPASHAYPDSEAAAIFITTVSALLTPGEGKKIEWGTLLKPDNKGNDRLTSLNSALKFQLDHYKWTEDQPSRELKSAIEECLSVIAALVTASQNSHGIATEPDEEMVQKWRETVNSAKLKVTTLRTIASGIPGNVPTAPPQMVAPVVPSASADNTAQLACLNTAAERMNTTQAVYTATQNNYAKASESAVKVEQELAKIKANLKNLEAEKITMEGVTAILIQCLRASVQMKAQITNLVFFFRVLSSIVEHVVKRNVQDLVKQVGSAPQLLTGGLTMLDISRQELHTISLMYHAYLSHFSTIAKMYTRFSVQYIRPGLRLCGEPTDDSEEAIAQRVRDLDSLTDEAQQAVRDIVAKTQKETSRTLENRVTMVSADISRLPPHLKLPAAMSKAIADGRDALTASAAEVFDEQRSAAVTPVNWDEI